MKTDEEYERYEKLTKKEKEEFDFKFGKINDRMISSIIVSFIGCGFFMLYSALTSGNPIFAANYWLFGFFVCIAIAALTSYFRTEKKDKWLKDKFELRRKD